LPKRFTLRRTEYCVDVIKVQSIRSIPGMAEKKRQRAYYTKLKRMFSSALASQHAGAFLTFDNHTIAVFRDQDYFYCFQTSEPSKKMLVLRGCKSTLTMFRDNDHLSSYLSQRLVQLDTPIIVFTVDLEVDCHTWADSSFNVHLPSV